MPTIRTIKKSDLHQVNGIIARAFTQGRIDDGYAYSRVPMCQPEFLDMYFAQCPQGSFLLEEDGQIQGAALCHIWGKTGWIGPLAIVPEKHHLGSGKLLAAHAVNFLIESGCQTIGLETNPRSNRNIGFYGKMGFQVSVLCIDMIKPVPSILPHIEKSPHEIIFYSRLSTSERADFFHHVDYLTKTAAPTIDYSSLIKSIDDYNQGETALFMRKGTPIGVAILQTEPSLAEEQNSLLRVVAFLAHPKTPDAYLPFFLSDFLSFAKSRSLDRILMRVPMYTNRAFHILLKHNYRVANSDLRMVLTGYPDIQNSSSFHVNRWV